MSVAARPTSQDAVLEAAFGAPVPALYQAVTDSEVPAALFRALGLRSFLAMAEEQVVRVRDRVHAATAADGDMDELSASSLRFDAQWMEAALNARDGYRSALGELLRTMPPPGPAHARPVQFTQAKITTALPPAAPAAPAPVRAGAARPPTVKAH